MIRNEKGQATIEFALMVSVLMILFLSVIDFGLIYYQRIRINYIGSEISTIVRNGGDVNDVSVYLANNSVNDYLNYDITYNQSLPASSGDIVEYNISRQIDIYGPVTKPILGNEYQVELKFVTVVEY